MRQAFRLIWRSGDPRPSTLEDLRLRAEGSRLLGHLVESLMNTEMGAKGRFRESLREEFQRAGLERVLGESATR